MLIDATTGAAPSVPPSEWLYIFAAIATLIATYLVIRSAWKKYVKQRQEEAVDKAESTKAMLGNAEATRANTAALEQMSRDVNAFVQETRVQLQEHRAELNGHNERLGRLEHPVK
jgi:hypothetical protein